MGGTSRSLCNSKLNFIFSTFSSFPKKKREKIPNVSGFSPISIELKVQRASAGENSFMEESKGRRLGRIGNEKRCREGGGGEEEEEEEENEINRKGEQNKVDRMEPKKRMPRTGKCSSLSLSPFSQALFSSKLYPAITTRIGELWS